MKSHIAIFRFTLPPGQSIGPSSLKSLWVRACRSVDVSVGRQVGGFASKGRPTYSLYAPQKLQGLAEIESRLRRLFEESKLTVTLTALHLG
jgi:hypothetical protein